MVAGRSRDQASPHKYLLQAESTLRQLNILIVDDHAGFRALLRELIGSCAGMLQWEGLDFRESRSCGEAVRSIAQSPPHLITIDLKMGARDGTECIRRLRALAPSALMIVVSHLCDQITVDASMRAGADTVVCKDKLAAIPQLLRRVLNVAGAT
jgi:DNA-binding NarL/FixJ family response regulator